MNLKDKSLNELEEMLKRKVEIENKDALEALKAKQRQELKDIRAEVARKKRFERKHMAENVGKYVIGKFDPATNSAFKNMSTEDYCQWVDRFIIIYNQHIKESQEGKGEIDEAAKNDDRS